MAGSTYRAGRAWRDELGDLLLTQSIGPRVSVNTTDSTLDFTTLADFNSYVFLNIQLNHDKRLGASLYPHLHWFQAQNNIPNMVLQYRWQVNGAAKTTAWTSIACNTPVFAYVAGTVNQIIYSAPIVTPVGASLSDIVQFRIVRDNANASGLFVGLDPYTVTAQFMSFDVHFEMDTNGSIGEYQK